MAVTVCLKAYPDTNLSRQISVCTSFPGSSGLEEIVQTYNRRIYNICYRFAGSSDDAEDLAQEVFIKMYRTLASYDSSKGAFVTWVTTITRNLLVDHFRKTKQDRITDSLDATTSAHEDAQPLSEQIQDQSAPPDARVRSREVGETVHAALAKIGR